MDLSRIFLKDACKTSIGGQAVMEGVMMRGIKRTAIAIRIPDGRIHVKTKPNKKQGAWAKIPLIRGVVAFVSSLVGGTGWLLYSADVLEHYMGEEEETPGKFEQKLIDRFGEKAVWNFMIYLSVIFSLIVGIGVFMLLPTVFVNVLKGVTKSPIVLNLVEGVLRILIFLVYILCIRRMEDIRRVFMYHGAEHKSIHCFENGLDLTVDNAKQFYTLHPRCGTSFLMFVMIISLILFSLLGWPSLAMRIVSRLVLIPVIAGLSYEILRWAGRSDSALVKVLSMPGLYLQKLTTAEPDPDQLQVGLVSLKAVLVADDAQYIEGICDEDGNLISEEIIDNR